MHGFAGPRVLALTALGAVGAVAVVWLPGYLHPSSYDGAGLPPQFSVVRTEESLGPGADAWVQGVRIDSAGHLHALVNVFGCGVVSRAQLSAPMGDSPSTVTVGVAQRGGGCAGQGWMLFADLGAAPDDLGDAVLGLDETGATNPDEGALTSVRVVDCRLPGAADPSGLCQLSPESLPAEP